MGDSIWPLVDQTDSNACFPRLTAAKTRRESASPGEGFRIAVCLGNEAVDGDLEIVNGWEDTALEAPARRASAPCGLRREVRQPARDGRRTGVA
jgi:hypothetical protein